MGNNPKANLDRVSQQTQRENERFLAMRPKSRAALERARQSMPRGVPMSWMTSLYHHARFFVAEATGIHFTDIDGNHNKDFKLGIAAVFCSHNPAPTISAACRRMARGSILQLPPDDAIWVGEELQRRYRQPKWQVTIAASQANAELLLLAHLASHRKKVLLFEGKYHGHVAPLLAAESNGDVVPGYRRIQAEEARETLIVPFNDLAAVESALRSGEAAPILTEPAVTNFGLISPSAGFHRELRSLAGRYGALLAINETQTQTCSYGGLSRLWNIDSDALVIGKSMASVLEPMAGPHEQPRGSVDEPALGGTIFANAVAMAACRAIGRPSRRRPPRHPGSTAAGVVDHSSRHSRLVLLCQRISKEFPGGGAGRSSAAARPAATLPGKPWDLGLRRVGWPDRRNSGGDRRHRCVC